MRWKARNTRRVVRECCSTTSNKPDGRRSGSVRNRGRSVDACTSSGRPRARVADPRDASSEDRSSAICPPLQHPGGVPLPPPTSGSAIPRAARIATDRGDAACGGANQNRSFLDPEADCRGLPPESPWIFPGVRQTPSCGATLRIPYVRGSFVKCRGAWRNHGGLTNDDAGEDPSASPIALQLADAFAANGRMANNRARHIGQGCGDVDPPTPKPRTASMVLGQHPRRQGGAILATYWRRKVIRP